MNRIRTIATAVLLIVMFAGCSTVSTDNSQYGLKEFAENTLSRVVTGLPQVRILPDFQGTIPPGGQTITIRNKLLHARVFAYGDRVGELGPDTELRCPISYNPFNAPVPLLAALYRNADFTEYVGVTVAMMFGSGSQIQQNTWTIGESGIVSAEGQVTPTVVGFTHPAPRASGASAECKFRIEALAGTSGLVLVNSTNFMMRVKNVRTGQYVLFDKGWPYYVKVRRNDLHPVGGTLNVHVDFVTVDAGGNVVAYNGSYDHPLPIVTDGVLVQLPVIITPQMIRR